MKRINLSISGMHCQSCVTLISKKLGKTDGIKYQNVNLTTEKAAVEFDEAIVSEDKIINLINSLGYKAYVVTDEKSSIDYEADKRRKEIIWCVQRPGQLF